MSVYICDVCCVACATSMGLFSCSAQCAQLYAVTLFGRVEPGYQTIRKHCISTSVGRIGPVTWLDPLPGLKDGREPLQGS